MFHKLSLNVQIEINKNTILRGKTETNLSSFSDAENTTQLPPGKFPTED